MRYTILLTALFLFSTQSYANEIVYDDRVGCSIYRFYTDESGCIKRAEFIERISGWNCKEIRRSPSIKSIIDRSCGRNEKD